MPPAVYVHIGAFKTGTSFLQSRLWAWRDDLADQGVLFPGERGWSDQVRALSHVAGRLDSLGRRVPAQPWEELVQTILAWPGQTAVMSFEFLSLARSRQAQRLVADLAPAEVHIVLTARDLVRAVPAMWQEVLQGGQTWSWPQYVETVMSGVGRTVPPGRTFWRAQDLPEMVRRWSSAVPVERIHVVTVPPAGAPLEELWSRFATATRIERADRLQADDNTPNESLDPASTELMRRINLAVEGRMSRAVYDNVLKLFVAKRVLASRAGPERVALSAEQVRWAQDRGRNMAAELRRLGVPVVGDLDDLVGSAVLAESREAETEEVLAAAIAVIEALALRLGESRRGRDRPPGGEAAGDQEGAGSAPPAATIGSRPVSRLVRTTYERFRR